jgi:creatinine amidohydrolase
MRRRSFLVSLAGLGTALLPAAPAVAAPPSRFIEDLTWIEVRDAVAAGASIALVPTGGTEQNGPHMAIGKHNIIVHYAAGAIAQRLGNALVAPVLAYVPEGGFDPPQGHMNFPGTVGVSEPVFAAVLRDAATSLALAGFRLICFLGDHGDSQPAQRRVADTLTRLWRRRGIRVVNLGRYYASNGQEEWLKAQGFSAAQIGQHAGLLDTAELMAIAPDRVRAELLSPQNWPAGASGARGDPTLASAAIGKKLLELKIAAGVAEAHEAAAAMGLPKD